MTNTTGTSLTDTIMRICAGREFSRNNPQGSAAVRLLVAVVLLTAASVLCSFGRYYGLALLVPAALHLWIAYQLMVRVRAQTQH